MKKKENIISIFVGDFEKGRQVKYKQFFGVWKEEKNSLKLNVFVMTTKILIQLRTVFTSPEDLRTRFY